MPLFAVDGTKMNGIPRARKDFFAMYVGKLGKTHVKEVRDFLDNQINAMNKDERELRNFSSSHLGSRLSPWPLPLSHLYGVSQAIYGSTNDEKFVQDQAALIFGLFVWECMTKRGENWTFYDPNLSSRDPNRELMGKTYFEQGQV